MNCRLYHCRAWCYPDVEDLTGGGGEWRVCAGGLRGYNSLCCFKKSSLRLVSVNTANKIVKNDKVQGELTAN